MKCAELQRFLLEAHEAGETLPEQMQGHLDRCASCQSLHADLIRMQEVSRGLEPPELPQGFEIALRRQLQRQAAQHPQTAGTTPADLPARKATKSWRWVWAAAAVVLLGVGATLLVGRLANDKAGPVTYHRLHLAINASQDRPDALIDIELPDRARLVGQAAAALGEGRRVSWRSRVRKGINEFDLPLVARGGAPVKVEARLTVGQRVWRATVMLDQRAAGTTKSGPRMAPRLAWVLDPSTPLGVLP